MTEHPLVAIPIRSFADAYRRLAPRLDRTERAHLARSLAGTAVDAVVAAGLRPTVLTRDPEVVAWTRARRIQVATGEGPAGGLDGAAEAAMVMAGPAGWIVLHADLPLVEGADVRALADALAETGAVLAPSHDGGTSAMGARRPIRPAYGPGSFVRHLARLPQAQIVVRAGLAFDVDTPAALDALAALEGRVAARTPDRLAAR